MMLMQALNYVMTLAFLLAAYLLFAVKDKVVTLNDQLNQVQKQINSERDTIHILKAELSYLSSPDRLRKLSSRYLNLETIKVGQMIKNPILGEDRAQPVLAGDNNINFVKHHSKWRYKKGPTKYLQMIANHR